MVDSLDESILNTTKSSLNLAVSDTAFDSDVKMFINSALSTVNQLGIGPPNGFMIFDGTETWRDLLGDEQRYAAVMAYMYLSVRLMFDPPGTLSVLNAFEKLKLEYEWRLNRHREDIVHPVEPRTDPVRDELWGDPVHIDGGDLDGGG